MGRIGHVLDFTRTKRGSANISDVKSDPGGGSNVTSQKFAPPGDDSHPMPGDYVSLEDVPRSGVSAAVGFADPKDSQLAQIGEKRLYSRDAGGNVIATIWLKNDGTIEAYNDNASVAVSPDGQIASTNAEASFVIDPDGQIASTNAEASFVIDPDGTISSTNAESSIVMEPTGRVVTSNAIATQDISALGVITTTTGVLTKTESPDGTFSVVNASGSFGLTAAGIFVVNGATIIPSGAIVSPVSVAAPSVIAAGRELAGHTHNETGIVTGPNN